MTLRRLLLLSNIVLCAAVGVGFAVAAASRPPGKPYVPDWLFALLFALISAGLVWAYARRLATKTSDDG
ncbi:MAG: hypothetical protein AAF690_24235 [Acidobacteriota bacterium]